MQGFRRGEGCTKVSGINQEWFHFDILNLRTNQVKPKAINSIHSLVKCKKQSKYKIQIKEIKSYY